jgi:uncharacterized damage-inducible protein DinB
MKRCVFQLALPLMAAVAFAATLTQGERDRAMSELHATRKAFLDSITGLSEAQWNFKPGPDAWSIAECAEHVAATEDAILDRVTKKILTGPAATPAPGAQRKDQQVLSAVADRSRKAQAPESLRPAKRWPGRAQLAAHFRNSRDTTIAFVRTTTQDLRAHAAGHPALGSLDAYQWILSIAAHAQRHVDQIAEIRANPRFPRR